MSEQLRLWTIGGDARLSGGVGVLQQSYRQVRSMSDVAKSETGLRSTMARGSTRQHSCGGGVGAMAAWQGSRARPAIRECGSCACLPALFPSHPYSPTAPTPKLRQLLHSLPKNITGIARIHTRRRGLHQRPITTPRSRRQLVTDRTLLCRKDERNKAGPGRGDAHPVHGR